MRNVFLEWYPPSDEALGHTWAAGTFVLDTNVILDIYRYPDDAKAQFLALLESLAERLWLPHQVGVEYLNNRAGIVPALRSAVENVLNRLEKAREVLQSLPLPENHPILRNDQVEGKAVDAVDAMAPLFDLVNSALERTGELVESADEDDDAIWARITEIFEGRAGSPWPKDEWEGFVEEARQRFQTEIPPGYRDAKKDEPDRFGDLLIWKQVIEAAKVRPEGKRATLFVTNDRKEDWWERKRGELRGPRRELIREYFEATGERLVMLTSSQFLAGAKEYLSADVSGEAIADVERVSAEKAVESLLWHKRMTLPPVEIRKKALDLIYVAVQDGKIAVAGDLDPLTNEIAAMCPVSSYVATPLFFSLVNRGYGPLIAEAAPDAPLRHRAIRFRDDSQSRSGFMDRGHAAWLAQGLFRIWHEDVADDAVLTAFFDESDGWAREILRTAKRFVIEAQGATGRENSEM